MLEILDAAREGHKVRVKLSDGTSYTNADPEITRSLPGLVAAIQYNTGHQIDPASVTRHLQPLLDSVR